MKRIPSRPPADPTYFTPYFGRSCLKHSSGFLVSVSQQPSATSHFLAGTVSGGFARETSRGTGLGSGLGSTFASSKGHLSLSRFFLSESAEVRTGPKLSATHWSRTSLISAHAWRSLGFSLRTSSIRASIFWSKEEEGSRTAA